MKKWLPVLIHFLFAFSIQSQNVNPAYLDGKVYVKFNKNGLKKVLQENPRNLPVQKLVILNDLVQKFGITKITRPFSAASDDPDLPYVLRIEFSKTNLIESFIADLSKVESIVYAEKVPLAKIDAVPNDPLFLTPGGGNHLNQINAQNAWNISTGNPSITVAIIDNAVMWTHADLIANTYTNNAEIANNGIDDDGNGYVDDRNGFDVADYDNNAVPTNTNMSHGTHCAGIAAATTNNGIGISGIGWNIKFIPVKCETDNGGTGNVTYGYEGIIYAVKAKAKVISCSWTNSPNVYSFTEQTVMNYAWNRGCIVVACAGNFSSNTPYYPGAYNNVYCVAAVVNSNTIAPYSNYGTWVDIAAPGTTIMSTVPYLGSAQYQQLSGTSMATPLVAGLAGLILSHAPNMTRSNVLNCISTSAANIYSLSGNAPYVSGNQLGAGLIDAYAALQCASNYTAIAPQANFYAFPKTSCPNTPISFYDSSNYAPSSWNWTFQGGTPATSTLANPSVQWLSPGTYSVSLSVSNNSGNNSITKLSYINVSVPSTSSLPFTEGFENSPFLPNGWSENNIQNDQVYWQRKIGVGGFATSTACAMFDNNTYLASGDRDEMRSPKFNFSNVVQAKLRFDVAYARFDATFSDTLEIKMSTNCGQNWSTIYFKGGSALATAPDMGNTFVPNASQWRVDSIDISAATAGQSNVMFSFINHGHFGQPIYLDNINLFFPAPQLSVNFNSVVCISNPAHYTNTSNGGINYNWLFQAGTPSTSSISNPTINYNSVGNYTFTLSANNGPTQSNLVQSLSVIAGSNIIATSSVVNATCAICNNGSIQLNTSGGVGVYTYSWIPNVSSAANANSLSVGCYTTLITDISGCSNSVLNCISFPDALALNNFNSEINIFPNPATEEINIENMTGVYQIKLRNSLGQLLLQKENVSQSIQISITEFPIGIYFIEIEKSGTTLRKKIIFN